MASLLFGVTRTDPVTFTVVTLLLAVVAFAATVIPARRALSIDPMVALREE
jgi:ABC-type lipoprotein release transport system permease subunit